MIRSDRGLTLEKSSFYLFTVVNRLYTQLKKTTPRTHTDTHTAAPVSIENYPIVDAWLGLARLYTFGLDFQLERQCGTSGRGRGRKEGVIPGIQTIFSRDFQKAKRSKEKLRLLLSLLKV